MLKSQGPFWTGTLWFRFKAKVSPSPFLSSPIKHRLYRVPHPCSLTSPRLCKKKHNNKPLPRNGQTENRDSTNNGQWLYSSSLTGSIAVSLFSFCSSLSSLLAAIYPTHEIPDTTNAPLFHRQTLHSRPLCSRPLHTHTHVSFIIVIFSLLHLALFLGAPQHIHTLPLITPLIFFYFRYRLLSPSYCPSIARAKSLRDLSKGEYTPRYSSPIRLFLTRAWHCRSIIIISNP